MLPFVIFVGLKLHDSILLRWVRYVFIHTNNYYFFSMILAIFSARE